MVDTRIKGNGNFDTLKISEKLSLTSRCRHPYVVKMSMIPKKYLSIRLQNIDHICILLSAHQLEMFQFLDGLGQVKRISINHFLQKLSKILF